jgi:hypothetical protein
VEAHSKNFFSSGGPAINFIRQKGQNLYQIYQNLSKENPNFDIGFLINKYISGGVVPSYEL